MLKKVAILANGGDVSGFNAVIRAIIKTAENKDIECYGYIDGYRGLLQNNIIRLGTSSTGNAVGLCILFLHFLQLMQMFLIILLRKMEK